MHLVVDTSFADNTMLERLIKRLTCKPSVKYFSDSQLFLKNTFTYSKGLPGLEDTLDQMSAGDRVLIVSPTNNISVFMQNSFPLLYISIILFGVSPDGIERLIRLARGGFVFPQIETVPELNDAVDCVNLHFFDAALEEVQERANWNETCIERLEVGRLDIFSTPMLKFCMPTTHVAEALMEPSWQWTRGLRVFRENTRGIKDVLVADTGPVGMELTPSSDGWTLTATHPPVSAIGVPLGSILVSINQHLLTPSSCLQTMMEVRPVCMTLSTKLLLPENSLSLMFSEELASSLLSFRSKNPYKTIPKKFGLSAQRPWKILLSEKATLASILTASCVVMCEYISLGRVGLTCSSNFESVFSEPKQSARLWRYIERRSGSCCVKIVATQLSVGGLEFAKRCDALTPACFTHCKEFTKLLRSEGVAIEILFVKMVSDISAINESTQISRMYLREGPCSIMWIRIFLALMTSFSNNVQSDILTDAMKFLSVSAITDSVLSDARKIPVTTKWFREWELQENSSG